MGKSTLKHQIDVRFDELMVPGLKKGVDDSMIRSFKTRDEYKRECQQFATWAKIEHPGEVINTLERLRPYAEEYLTRDKPNGEKYSAWTVRKRCAAIAKLYGVANKDIMENLPKRLRSDIKRSRSKDGIEVRPIADQPDYEALGRAFGLRKGDFSRLYRESITFDGKDLVAYIDNGKGGKERDVVALPEYADRILEILDRTEPGKRIIPKGSVPNRFDEHSCRRYYARTKYAMHARPLDTLTRKEKYYCRKDKVGVVFDRAAMSIVSHNLGHNRLCVVAISYLA